MATSRPACTPPTCLRASLRRRCRARAGTRPLLQVRAPLRFADVAAGADTAAGSGTASAAGIAAVADAPATAGGAAAAPAAAAGAPRTEGRPAGFAVTVRCRNRFAEGDRLEVLVPGRRAFEVVARNLAWLPEPDEADPHPAPCPVPVANRSCARYRFFVAAEAGPLEPGWFLRKREHRRSSRH